MGCASAWKMAGAGLRVIVLEKSVPGAEASSAAAGILGAHAEAESPGVMADLLLAGLRRYPDWAGELARATGIDVEYRKCGVLRVGFSAREAERVSRAAAWMTGGGRRFRIVSARAARRLEPALAPVAGGLVFPDDGRVDPRIFFRAVHVAARRAGVRFETGAYVRSILVERNRARGVAVDGGVEYRAPLVVLAAGSWSGQVLGSPLAAETVTPARGQMIELESPAPLVDHVIHGPGCYVVPRDDGRTLVGSTVEFVGYRREVTAGAVRDLLGAATALVPALGDASLRATWSNFRPYTRDELPILGKTSVRGLLLATGHHRNGILLAPLTAEITCALSCGKKPPVDVAPFEISRFAST